ncbi:MAG: hypothetical protein C0623_06505 [Desulfuromonas sp.]|nr:MAG: hypothetical protein C0623_06505 [Desulfuromonas sp.]
MTEQPAAKKYFRLTLKQWLLLIIVVPGIPFVLTSLFIVIYSTVPWPTGQKVEMGKIDAGVEEVIVLIHGKGDQPSSWADGFAAEIDALLLNDRQQAVTVNWSEYSTDLFRSTLNARRIGHALGAELSAFKNLEKLHLIGHSAGSFVVYGICERIKEERAEVFVQSTYLDPVGIYAGVDWGYGPRNFGSCGDISDAYIDREDGVPGSNAPLDHPHTFDVTARRKAAGFKGLPHLWPIEYYRRAVLGGTLPYWQPEEAALKRYPPGGSTILE